MAKILPMPGLSPGMEQGTLESWTKNIGDFVESGDVLAHIEADKAVVEYEMVDDGYLRHVFLQPGDSAPVGAPFAIIAETDHENIGDLIKEAEHASTPELMQLDRQPDYTTQAAAQQHRIVGIAPPISIDEIEGEYEEIPLTSMRKTIATRLLKATQSTPTFYLTTKIRMDNLLKLRKELKNTMEMKISVNDMIIKACGKALIEHPQVNSRFTDTALLQFKNAHVGFAVATPDGLITPIVRNVNQKELGQISKDTTDLTNRAREKKLAPHEFTGGTFGTSNLGMFGIDHFTAIINPPQSCSLAIGQTSQELQLDKEGNVCATQIMKMTLSCDHRIVDGAVGAQFLKTLKKILENPKMLMM